MQKGYEQVGVKLEPFEDDSQCLQYQDGMFKLPFTGQWITIASSKFIDEIVHAPETHLSFQETLNYVIRT